MSAIEERGDINTSVQFFLDRGAPTSARILDIGTRFGSFCNALHAGGYKDVTGIDIDKISIEKGKEKYPDIAQRLLHYSGERLPFSDGSFDIVCMFDVIEHIPVLDPFLKDVLRILAPEGLLVFQTPNILTNVPWEILQTKSLTKWRTYHCSLQSCRSLKRVILRAGFEQLHITKMDLGTDFKRDYAREKLGMFGYMMVRFVSMLPLPMPFVPNFWGSCRKPGALAD